MEVEEHVEAEVVVRGKGAGNGNNEVERLKG